VESKSINFAEEVLFYYVNKGNYFISENLWVGLHQICWHNRPGVEYCGWQIGA